MRSRPGRMRARDIDRITAMAALDSGYADGQLSGPEYRDRVEHARTATTLGELEALVGDLQRADDPPGPRPRYTARNVVGVGALVLMVALLGAVLVGWPQLGRPTAPAAAPSVSVADTAARTPPTTTGTPILRTTGPMYTVAGLTEIVNAVRTRFGKTVIEGMHLYPDKAEVHVSDGASAVGHLRYQYSLGGEFYSAQVYGGNAVSSLPGSVVDLAALDIPRVATMIAGAPERLGLVGFSTRSPFRVTVGGGDGGEIWVGVNDISLDSHLVARLDGTIKGVQKCGWGC